MPQRKLDVQLISPKGSIFVGFAKAISSINPQGRFDIFPGHSRFISIIKDFLIVHINSKEFKEFKFSEAVLKCFDDKVVVYIGV